MSTLFGTFSTWYFNNLPARPATEFKFYGTPFMSMAAIYYWMFGDGSARTMNIASLNLKMSLDDFGPINQAVQNPAYGPGTYPFDAEFSTNLFNHQTKDLWAAGVIGRVGGRVTGTLEIGATGDYVFNGSFTLNPDRYKAYDYTGGTYQISRIARHFWTQRLRHSFHRKSKYPVFRKETGSLSAASQPRRRRSSRIIRRSTTPSPIIRTYLRV
ncbi:lipid II-degrading bacteriocin [Burkholderia cenocepacia]|uniref:lipid II-degrading bacteriocin n=1 Tax=Burkholderia cenocepacia TaxID=95486 RepID=UPI002AB63174|nr:lipid II-degrading bacteriocin [Burkholderia cenocepacia]